MTTPPRSNGSSTTSIPVRRFRTPVRGSLPVLQSELLPCPVHHQTVKQRWVAALGYMSIGALICLGALNAAGVLP